MDFWYGFLVITGVHLLVAMSPGPDFVYVSQQTLSRGRRAGMLCSVGIALGLSVHISYSILGLSALIANAAWLLTAIKIIGGAYLIWLGIQGLRARAAGLKSNSSNSRQKALRNRCGRAFCATRSTRKPLFILFRYLPSCYRLICRPVSWRFMVRGMVLQFAWFASVVWLLSIPRVNRQFQKAGHWIDRVLGMAMVGLGVKVVAS